MFINLYCSSLQSLHPDPEPLFQELALAQLQIHPYSEFNGWEDVRLCNKIASKVRLDKFSILRVLTAYKTFYSVDNTLARVRPISLRTCVLMVFGSGKMLGNLDVNALGRVLQELSASVYPYPHTLQMLTFRIMRAVVVVNLTKLRGQILVGSNGLKRGKI